MAKIKNMTVTVNTDEMKAENFDGTLSDFACKRVNERLDDVEFTNWHVVSVESNTWESEMRPRQDNSDTWYTRTNMRLCVWLELDRRQW